MSITFDVSLIVQLESRVVFQFPVWGGFSHTYYSTNIHFVYFSKLTVIFGFNFPYIQLDILQLVISIFSPVVFIESSIFLCCHKTMLYIAKIVT